MKKMMAMLLASVMAAGTFTTTAFAYTGDDVQKNTPVSTLHRRRMQQKAQMRGKRTIPTASKSTRTCRFCRMAMRSLRMRMGT